MFSYALFTFAPLALTLEFQTFKPFNRYAPFNSLLRPPPRPRGRSEVGV